MSLTAEKLRSANRPVTAAAALRSAGLKRTPTVVEAVTRTIITATTTTVMTAQTPRLLKPVARLVSARLARKTLIVLSQARFASRSTVLRTSARGPAIRIHHALEGLSAETSANKQASQTNASQSQTPTTTTPAAVWCLKRQNVSKMWTARTVSGATRSTASVSLASVLSASTTASVKRV